MLHTRARCVCVYHICAWPWRLEEGIRSLIAEVTDGCDPSCGHWELNPTLQEQQVLTTTEPSPAHSDTGSCCVALSGSELAI